MTTATRDPLERFLGHCRQEGCGATVLWVPHERTGKTAPIDPEMDDGLNGNIAIDAEAGTYRVESRRVERQRQARAHGQGWHCSHWMTCKNPPVKYTRPHR